MVGIIFNSVWFGLVYVALLNYAVSNVTGYVGIVFRRVFLFDIYFDSGVTDCNW